jgi:predicted ribosome quality control (RQC) complex YloA/Tae2 family protein
VSNTIRYDALLARHLARELHTALAGQRVRGVWFQREQGSLDIVLERQKLSWDLNLGPRLTDNGAPAGPSLLLPRRPRVQDIAAVPDERILRLRLAGGSRPDATASLVVELLPPRPNIIALDVRGRVLKQLAPTASRPQVRGQVYQLPAARPRAGTNEPLSLEAWLELFSPHAPAERQRVFIEQVAYASPINAAAVLGEAATESGMATLERAYGRYREVLAEPMTCHLLANRQPYGHHLWQDARPCTSLLAAFAQIPDSAARSTLQQIDTLLEREQRKRARQLSELETAAQSAQALRADADLLLAHSRDLKRGTETVALLDFQGHLRELRLDPSMSSTANAQAWYVEARKRARAARQLPALLDATDARIRELQEKRTRAAAGETVELPARPAPGRRVRPERRLPYHRFQTAGGLEVRVGRSSQANDELTLRHTRPEDIWLHAREVGGAHVVLRWEDPDASPPRRDLEQAATLAALHSKGRHSGVVAVDWTRGKYVRKPRGAPPGAVRIERVETLFVTPDSGLLTALRSGETG